MINLLMTANWLLPLVYLALLIDYGATFTLRLRPQAPARWLAIGVLFHAVYLTAAWIHGGWGVVSGPYLMPTVLAFLMAAVYLIVEFATRDRRTGAFVLLPVFLFQYTSSMFFYKALPAFEASAASSSGWQEIHVIPAALAYTALAFAGIYGLVHLIAARGLKRHRAGVLFDRLPPLETLARMTWFALLAGFIFITVAIVAAPLVMMGHGATAGASHEMEPKLIAKIAIGLLAWVVYAVAVVGRLWRRWAPARISGVAFVGFLIVMALLVASGVLS